MRIKEDRIVRLSVRELVEFVHRSGDIDSRRSGPALSDAMLAGTAAHKRIQRSMGAEYEAEVSLDIDIDLDGEAVLALEGRADGVIRETNEDGTPKVTIDEIKGVYRDVQKIEVPEPVHLAQAMCYAYVISERESLPEITIQVTYVELDEESAKTGYMKATGPVQRLSAAYSFEDVKTRFLSYIEAYKKWAIFVVRHRAARAASADGFPFPYDYRPGQKTIVRQVWHTVEQEGHLFVQAPTGIGKTLAMLYPSVEAVGQGMGDKIFYLTAKTVTSTVAEEGMSLMYGKGLRFSFTKITAKEKLCPLEACACDPVSCERAHGHFDRVNDAVYDCITHENAVTTDVILKYAAQYCVCPYEMCLDISLYTDVIICDYNYAFAPHVALKRYFAAERKQDFIFLMDEAHNLTDRAREMYSAVLVKEDLLAAKKLFEGRETILKWLNSANKIMLELKRECESVRIFTEESFPNALIYALTNLYEAIRRFLDRNPNPPHADEILDFFFVVSDFLRVFEELDDGYLLYSSFMEDGHFYIKLFCVDPSEQLKKRLDLVRASVFFSATFLPINYYKELLAGDTDEPAIYVDSPFDPANRRLLIASDVSSKYTRRGAEEYRKIADYLIRMTEGKNGHYLAFLPSHKFLEEVAEVIRGREEKIRLITQKRIMSEEERIAFLQEFEPEAQENPDGPLLGMCVMGGVFSEGIDLKNDALIGVAVVGTGLPQVCSERELIKNYFTDRDENGFDFSYRFPGFNKVMQAAGRLIRTVSDEGVILLLDERFGHYENQRLFPKEWADFETVTISNVSEKIHEFWESRENGE